MSKTDETLIHKLTKVALNSAEYADGIDAAFNAIDDNFSLLANHDFVKGDRGNAVSIKCINLNEHQDLKDKLCEEILKGNLYGGLPNDINGHQWDEYLSNELYVVFEEGEETTTILSSLYYTFVDARYYNGGIGDYSNQKDNILSGETDLSCILTYNGEKFERLNVFPTMYYEDDKGLCWKVNSQYTGIPVQGVPGLNGKNSDILIVKIHENEVDENGKGKILERWSKNGGWLTIPTEEYSKYDGYSCFALAPSSNLNVQDTEYTPTATTFYIGTLLNESDGLYVVCKPELSLQHTFGSATFVEIMQNISLWDNSDLMVTPKGLFIPMKSLTNLENGEEQPLHLISATSINNEEGNNSELMSDMIITPVSSHSIKVTDDAPIKINKYLYVDLSKDIYEKLFKKEKGDKPKLLKYKLTNVIKKPHINKPYFSAAFDPNKLLICKENAFDEDGKPIMENIISIANWENLIPQSYLDRVSNEDSNKNIGYYQWTYTTLDNDFDPENTLRLSQDSNEYKNIAAYLNTVYTTTMSPGLGDDILLINSYSVVSKHFYEQFKDYLSLESNTTPKKPQQARVAGNNGGLTGNPVIDSMIHTRFEEEQENESNSDWYYDLFGYDNLNVGNEYWDDNIIGNGGQIGGGSGGGTITTFDIKVTGYVYDENHSPVNGFTVMLLDENDKVIRHINSSNDEGVYVIYLKKDELRTGKLYIRSKEANKFESDKIPLGNKVPQKDGTIILNVTVRDIPLPKCKNPNFSIPTGEWTIEDKVVLSCPYPNKNATIYYKVDDGEPKEYTEPIGFDEFGTFKITAYAEQLNCTKSDEVSNTYIIKEIPQINKVSAPIVTPNGGEIAEGENIMVTCRTEGATIHYTINGEQKEYTEPFGVTEDCTISFIATKYGWEDSNVVTVTFDFKEFICPNCGNVVLYSDEICGTCGRPKYEEWSEEDKTQCWYCGNYTSRTPPDRKCWHCGMKQDRTNAFTLLKGVDFESLKFSKFIPMYEHDHSVNHNTTLNLNYDVNVMGDTKNPSKTLSVYGNVNCENINADSLNLNGEINKVITNGEIRGNKGLSVARKRFVVDSLGNATAQDINSKYVDTKSLNTESLSIKRGDVTNLSVTESTRWKDSSTFLLENVDKINIRRATKTKPLGIITPIQPFDVNNEFVPTNVLSSPPVISSNTPIVVHTGGGFYVTDDDKSMVPRLGVSITKNDPIDGSKTLTIDENSTIGDVFDMMVAKCTTELTTQENDVIINNELVNKCLSQAATTKTDMESAYNKGSYLKYSKYEKKFKEVTFSNVSDMFDVKETDDTKELIVTANEQTLSNQAICKFDLSQNNVNTNQFNIEFNKTLYFALTMNVSNGSVMLKSGSNVILGIFHVYEEDESTKIDFIDGKSYNFAYELDIRGFVDEDEEPNSVKYRTHCFAINPPSTMYVDMGNELKGSVYVVPIFSFEMSNTNVNLEPFIDNVAISRFIPNDLYEPDDNTYILDLQYENINPNDVVFNQNIPDDTFKTAYSLVFKTTSMTNSLSVMKDGIVVKNKGSVIGIGNISHDNVSMSVPTIKVWYGGKIGETCVDPIEASIDLLKLAELTSSQLSNYNL